MEGGTRINFYSEVVPVETVNIWCDASQRRVEQTELNPRGRKVSFAAWIADSGHYWFDLVWAKRSHEAEVEAIMVALDWALSAGYHEINIYTDDSSIPGSLYGKSQGGAILSGIREAIDENIATVKIIPIIRKENKAAHKLCDQAFVLFSSYEKIPKGGKIVRSYLNRDLIAKSRTKAYISPVCEPLNL